MASQQPTSASSLGAKRQRQQAARLRPQLPRRPSPVHLPLLLLLPLLLPSPHPRHVARADLLRYYGNISYPLDEQLSYCDTLGPLYDGIGVDLALWNTSGGGGSSSAGGGGGGESNGESGGEGGSSGGGITEEALQLAIDKYTTKGSQKVRE